MDSWQTGYWFVDRSLTSLGRSHVTSVPRSTAYGRRPPRGRRGGAGRQPHPPDPRCLGRARSSPAAGRHPALPGPHAAGPRSASPTCSARMTLAEKIGQMTQAERGVGRRRHRRRSPPTTSAACCPAAAPCPTPNTPTAWADMVDRYQRAALATRLHIPLIYGVDTVHGDGNMYGATVFPHNIGLGATRDPALVRRGRARRRRGDPRDRPAVGLRAVHLRGARRPLGPHLRVVRRGPRGSSSRWRPRSTASRARPVSSTDTDRVLATAKHFAGDGLTTYGTGSNNQHRQLPDRPGRRPGRPRDVRPARARAVRARGARAPRRHRDAVVLRRRLDRGRPRQPASTCTATGT